MEVFKETPVVEVATEEKTEQMDPAATEDQSSDVTETKVKQESEENKQVSASCSMLEVGVGDSNISGEGHSIFSRGF